MASSVRPIATPRVTMLMQSNLLMSSINSTSSELMTAQAQLSSGLRILRPSDDPSGATVVMSLDSQLERQNSYLDSISKVGDYLAATDSSLQQATDLVNEAYNLALVSVGDTIDDAGRQANAIMIDSIIDQLVEVGNQTNYGSYIFGGLNATEQPFTFDGGGVMFEGDTGDRVTRINDDSLNYFSIDGDEAFGGLSGQVVGIADINPQLTGDTLLADVNGTVDRGIRKGSLAITVGTDTFTVDLNNAVTINDVVNLINDTSGGLVNTHINPASNGLEIDATPAATLKVSDIGSGTVASDLGINTNGTTLPAGTDLVGQDIDARLTSQTSVTALAGIDLTSGIVIKNSLMPDINPISFSTCNTVGDMINLINTSNIGVRAEINDSSNGINIVNQLSGSNMTIGENGGTTAEDLGIRSFTSSTLLSEFNDGAGVGVDQGVIRINDANGTGYSVDLTGSVTVQNVIDKINVATGGVVTASLATNGNGFVLTDLSGGAGSLSVGTLSENGYDVAKQLGLSTVDSNVTFAGNTLQSEDVNTIKPAGLFSNLMALRDAMVANDDAEMTRISELLAEDRDQLINMNGVVGSMHKSIEQRQTYMEDNILATKTLRSDIRDIDFTEAITRYENLYTALQANLMAGSSQNQMTLLDFLG